MLIIVNLCDTITLNINNSLQINFGENQMRKDNELKYQLLEEMLSMGGNYKPEESKAVKLKLQDYAENNKDDLQIRDALIVLKTFEIESRANDFETCCILAIPIFERLKSTSEWDFYDIRILTNVIDYAETLEQVNFLASKALDELENYSSKKQYKHIKLGVLLNMTNRLLREKFSEKFSQHIEDKLEETFSEYANLVIELCDETDIIPKTIILVRKGIFYRDISIANEGFDLLKENGEHEVYKLLHAEAIGYKLTNHIDEDDKKQFHALLDELFAIGGNYKSDESKAIKLKLQSYAEIYKDNLQIRDALIVLKIFDIEGKSSDFETCGMLSVPIFERLDQTSDWEFYDIRILTCIIGYAQTYMQAHSLVSKALDNLDNYLYKKQYKSIKLSILINMTLRLLRERFSQKNNHNIEGRLAEVFSEYANSIMELCDETDIVYKAIILVRTGSFYRDFSIANKGFDLLRESDEHELYKLLRDEARDYKLNIHINKEEKKSLILLLEKILEIYEINIT